MISQSFFDYTSSLLCLSLGGIPLDAVYVFCLVVGVGYTVVQMVFGGGGEGGVLGDVDIDVGDVDLGVGEFNVADIHDVHIHGADSADLAGGDPSPVNAVTITNFVSSFGGIGIISRALGASPLVSVLISVPVSVLISYGIFLFLYKFLFSQQGSSMATHAQFEGITAEVITPIPEKGFGEIAYVLQNSRMTSPARSFTKEPVSKGELVRIVSMAGNTAYVKKIGDIYGGSTKKAIEDRESKD